MKYLRKRCRTILLLALFLVPTLSFSQTKNDVRITVIPSDTADLFNRVVKYLYDKDYVLDQKDKEGGLLLTKDKTLENDRTFAVKYKIRFADSTMVITGEVWSMLADGVFNNNQQRTYIEIFYGGTKKSPLRKGWNEMEAIALAFGTNIKYSK